MLARLAGLAVRVLLEASILLLVMGALLGLLAFRVSRRLVVTGQDPLERMSGPAGTVLGMLAALSRRENADESVEE